MVKTGRPPIGEESKNKRLHIRVTPAQYEDIKNCAEKLNLTITDTVLKAIENLKKEIEKE